MSLVRVFAFAVIEAFGITAGAQLGKHFGRWLKARSERSKPRRSRSKKRSRK